MGDGLSAAIGAGDEIGGFVPARRGAGSGLGRAADKAGPLGTAAGLAKHGACPQGCLPQCRRQFIAVSSPDRPILPRFAMSPGLPAKKSFCKDRIAIIAVVPWLCVPRTGCPVAPSMDMILVKLFATALALSEATTQPQAVKTQVDPVADRDAVGQILGAGCAPILQ